MHDEPSEQLIKIFSAVGPIYFFFFFSFKEAELVALNWRETKTTRSKHFWPLLLFLTSWTKIDEEKSKDTSYGGKYVIPTRFYFYFIFF